MQKIKLSKTTQKKKIDHYFWIIQNLTFFVKKYLSIEKQLISFYWSRILKCWQTLEKRALLLNYYRRQA